LLLVLAGRSTYRRSRKEIVKQEIITSHAAIKELYNRLGKTIEEFEEKVEELKSDQ